MFIESCSVVAGRTQVPELNRKFRAPVVREARGGWISPREKADEKRRRLGT